MSLTGTREASHAYTWYDGDPDTLSKQLDGFLGDVPSSINDNSLPITGAKVIIAPHAGYSYSGPCAAWAYKCLDLSKAKRIFVLGPSHTYYLRGCALTTFAKYETPFGDLTVDADAIQQLRDTGKFQDISRRNDVEEHSLEMHLPYIHKRASQALGDAGRPYPTIVPVLVGDNSGAEEKEFGALLAPHLRDPAAALVVSSDFCHWGARFGYTAYAPGGDVENLQSLTRRSAVPADPPVHESIRQLDHLAMDAVESGDHDAFVDNLRRTKNTVCGRHPIGVAMAALEVLAREDAGADAGAGAGGRLRFKFVQYQRSSLVKDYSDSSVSYASAYAIV
ncbi:MEMO1 family [Biscogniauxia marginata]|nr:MEMO1 family [Biscogniauxia marginata]